MAELSGKTFDHIYYDVLYELMSSPDHICSPRGMKIRELIAPTLVLKDPTARLINCPARNANYGFATGEFLWYWGGRTDLETMLYYNKRMGDYSNDGTTINSAYGFRMRKARPEGWFTPKDWIGEVSQWEIAIKTLVDDPDSRRAILHVNSPYDEFEAVALGSKDVPCTLALQFFIRDSCLHLHVTMRSNDVVWGLTNDLFSFTLFQECMLMELRSYAQFKELRLGKYYHTAGSLHIYERHFELAEKMMSDYVDLFHDPKGFNPEKMEQMPDLRELARLSEDEQFLREKKGRRLNESRYTGGCLWLASQLNTHRQKRDEEGVR